MSIQRNLDCLYSTVRNTSGQEMNFSFLPPHGRRLPANSEFTVFGNILEAINGNNRLASRRRHQAFVSALENGLMTIVTTPAPVLDDTVTGLTKTLVLSGGTLAVATPCWLSAGSESLAA